MVALPWEHERLTTDLTPIFYKSNVKSSFFQGMLQDAAPTRVTGGDDTGSPQIRVTSQSNGNASCSCDLPRDDLRIFSKDIHDSVLHS